MAVTLQQQEEKDHWVFSVIEHWNFQFFWVPCLLVWLSDNLPLFLHCSKKKNQKTTTTKTSWTQWSVSSTLFWRVFGSSGVLHQYLLWDNQLILWSRALVWVLTLPALLSWGLLWQKEGPSRLLGLWQCFSRVADHPVDHFYWHKQSQNPACWLYYYPSEKSYFQDSCFTLLMCLFIWMRSPISVTSMQVIIVLLFWWSWTLWGVSVLNHLSKIV